MMLNTKKRPLIAAALLLTSFGITTSCIDNSYDLNKDIDMTISAGGEHLAIPVGYTERIKSSNWTRGMICRLWMENIIC
jgi:hypothetical protein